MAIYDPFGLIYKQLWINGLFDLENKIQELNTQLREARKNIFKLVKLQTETEKERDEARARLRELAGEAARLRREVANLQ